MKPGRISPSTVARLPIYIKGLQVLARAGESPVSSERLAQVTGVGAPRIRRDLSYLGALGTPGVGYDVKELLGVISRCVGLSRSWPVALAGYGSLGAALTVYGGFADRNFQVAAVFDSDPRRIGLKVGDLEVLPPARLPAIIKEKEISIAIIASQADSAQYWADMLVKAGVTSLLNFAPVTLRVPRGVEVRSVDLTSEIQMLSFHETMKRTNGTSGSLHIGDGRHLSDSMGDK